MMISEEEKKYYKTSANNYKDLAKFSVTSNLMNGQTALNGLGANCLTYNRYPLISWMKKMWGFGNFRKGLSLAAKQNYYKATGPKLEAHHPTF